MQSRFQVTPYDHKQSKTAKKLPSTAIFSKEKFGPSIKLDRSKNLISLKKTSFFGDENITGIEDIKTLNSITSRTNIEKQLKSPKKTCSIEGFRKIQKTGISMRFRAPTFKKPQKKILKEETPPFDEFEEFLQQKSYSEETFNSDTSFEEEVVHLKKKFDIDEVLLKLQKRSNQGGEMLSYQEFKEYFVPKDNSAGFSNYYYLWAFEKFLIEEAD